MAAVPLVSSERQEKSVLGTVTAGWLAMWSAQSLSLQASPKHRATTPTRWLHRETKLLGCCKQLCTAASLPALRDGWRGGSVAFRLLKSCLAGARPSLSLVGSPACGAGAR